MAEAVHHSNGVDTQGAVSEIETTYDSVMIGLDVGSTTVKAVVMDPETDEILWKDGEVNVKSRVQMKLYEAKMKARQEIKDMLGKHHVTLEQVKDYVAKHPKYSNAMLKVSQHHGISTTANLVAEVAGRIKE